MFDSPSFFNLSTDKNQLVVAVCQNKQQVVNQLLDKHGVAISNEDLGEVFIIAAESGAEEIFNTLLNRVGTKISNKHKGRALIVASNQGRSEIVSTLLEKVGTQISLKDKNEALRLAATKHHSSIVTALLDHMNEEISQDNLVCHPSVQDNREIFSLIINHPNAAISTKGKELTLFVAASDNRTEIVKELLNDEVIQDSFTFPGGFNGLFVAKEKGHLGVVMLFSNFLENAVCARELHAVKALLSASPKISSDNVSKAFITAAEMCELEIVTELLDKAGSKIPGDTIGEALRGTIVSEESNRRIVKTIKAILDKAGTEIPDEDKILTLLSAVAMGNIPVVKILLSHETFSDISVGGFSASLIKNPKAVRRLFTLFQSYFNAAVRKRVSGLVSPFLETCPQISKKSKSEALLDAAENGHALIIFDLLSRVGADLSKDDKGKALRKAAKQGHNTASRTILQMAGTEISIEDKERALYLAAYYGHNPTVSSLLELIGAEITPEGKGEALKATAEDYANHDTLRLLLTSIGAEISDNDKGLTLVNAASCMHGDVVDCNHPEIVTTLLNEVGDQISIAHKLQALETAIELNNRETVKILLTHAAVRDEISTGNFASLAKARQEDFSEIVKLYADFLCTAVRHNRLDVCASLLTHAKAEITAENKGQALVIAAENGNLLMLCLLLGVNGVPIPDAHKTLALLEAAKKGHVEVTRTLLTLDSILASIAAGELTALREAQRRGHRAVVNLFRGLPGTQELMNSIAFFALDPENALTDLTPGQSRALGALKERYAERLQGEEWSNTLKDIRKYLTAQYQQHPMMHEGQPLPLEYDPQYSPAVQALYHTHPVHSAYRYIFGSPNRWLNQTTTYAVRNLQGEGRAYILEEDQATILSIWLFITDPLVDKPMTYSQESLKALFVQQMSLAGRGHNWDAPIGVPERDDGEKDNPSCASGLRLRLSQFLDVLISEINLPELRDLTPKIMKDYVKAWLITSGDGERLLNLIDKLNLEQLRALANAVDNFSLMAMGNYDLLEKDDNAVLTVLHFHPKTIGAFIEQSKLFYGASRFGEKQPLILNNKTFKSYESLIHAMVTEPLAYFGSEINEKIQSRIKELSAMQLILIPERVVIPKNPALILYRKKRKDKLSLTSADNQFGSFEVNGHRRSRRIAALSVSKRKCKR